MKLRLERIKNITTDIIKEAKRVTLYARLAKYIERCIELKYLFLQGVWDSEYKCEERRAD